VRTRRAFIVFTAAALVAAVAAGGSLAGAGTGSWPRHTSASVRLADHVTVLRPRAAARLGRAVWHGGELTAAGGERVGIYVSDDYASDAGAAQRWADFFGGLVHGSELSLITVYVATPADAADLCGDADALGCYGEDRLVIPGEASGGVDPTMGATHECGAHVAAHRLNAPWRALDWGTKRWASHLDVCGRTAGGAYFPGDEGDHYTRNPGEGFAETYRALNESLAGTTSSRWAVVNPAFYPDQAALDDVREDVIHPWAAPSARVAAGRFVSSGSSMWTLPLATPLDGDLELTLTLPKFAPYGLTLLGAGGQELAHGLWSSRRQQTLHFQVCGERSLLVRVTRAGAPGRFSVKVSQP